MMDERKAVKYHDRLVAMLQRVEWCGRFARCPCCWGETDQGHAPECALAALLAEIDAKR